MISEKKSSTMASVAEKLRSLATRILFPDKYGQNRVSLPPEQKRHHERAARQHEDREEPGGNTFETEGERNKEKRSEKIGSEIASGLLDRGINRL